MNAVSIAPAPPRTRPESVTVIGWVWLIFGILRTIGSLTGLFLWRSGLGETLTGPHSPLAPFLPATALRAASGNFTVSLVLQLCAGVLFLWSAIDLWRLRPWARVAIQFFCWLGLCFVAPFTILWLFFWFGPMAPAVALTQRRVAAVVVLVVGGGLISGFVAMIRALRSEEVRRAFLRTAAPGGIALSGPGGFA
jgi:hypothetical protein